MAHINKQVRDAFVSRLGGVATLQSVSSNRAPDLQESDLPAAIVATESDEVELQTKPDSTSDAVYRRNVNVAVVVVVTAADPEDIDDVCDALRAEIETAIEIDQDLGIGAFYCHHTGGELEVMSEDEGAIWIAFLTLNWIAQVWTTRGAPEVIDT